jgi:hypothetical protein
MFLLAVLDAASGLNMLNTTNLDYFAAHHQVTTICDGRQIGHLAVLTGSGDAAQQPGSS